MISPAWPLLRYSADSGIEGAFAELGRKLMKRVCTLAAAICAGVLSSTGFGAVTGSAGNSAPVSTIQPSLGINYLIRTQGMFPSEFGSPVGTIGEITGF